MSIIEALIRAASLTAMFGVGVWCLSQFELPILTRLTIGVVGGLCPIPITLLNLGFYRDVWRQSRTRLALIIYGMAVVVVAAILVSTEALRSS